MAAEIRALREQRDVLLAVLEVAAPVIDAAMAYADAVVTAREARCAFDTDGSLRDAIVEAVSALPTAGDAK